VIRYLKTYSASQPHACSNSFLLRNITTDRTPAQEERTKLSVGLYPHTCLSPPRPSLVIRAHVRQDRLPLKLADVLRVGLIIPVEVA
jgi:hypothetical protein